MLSEAIRRRLEQLDGRADRARGGGSRSAAVNVPHSPPLAVSSTDEHAAPLAIEHSSSPAVSTSTSSEESNSAGTHLRLRRPLAAVCPGSIRSERSLVGWPSGRGPPGRPRSCPASGTGGTGRARAAPGMYLDLETCGFAGSMIFLVGLIWHDGNEWWLDQLLAPISPKNGQCSPRCGRLPRRNGCSAAPSTASLRFAEIKDRGALVYDFVRPGQSGPQAARAGKTHDRPLLAAEVPAPAGTNPPRRLNDELPRSDLLHCAAAQCDLRALRPAASCPAAVARFARLPVADARAHCRRRRRGDVSGAAVPAAYHDYVRRGELRLIEPVLHHNALDLVTLVQIGQAHWSSPLERMAESA